MRILAILIVLAACGGPSRSTYARHPGAPTAFDRASSKPEALEIADKVLAAHGGAVAWDNAKQIKWHQAIVRDGKTVLSGKQAWDRWNARHMAEVDREEGANMGVIYEIYGGYTAGYVLSKSTKSKQPVPSGEVKQAVGVAKSAWQRDATVLLAPFLMHEPGATVEYVGLAKDETTGTEFQELKVTFDPKDTARANLVMHVFADKATSEVGRVEIVVGADRFAYQLGGYQTVGGLKLSTLWNNGEVKITDLKVGDVDDELYTVPMFGPSGH